jgi:hypothetical protein
MSKPLIDVPFGEFQRNRKLWIGGLLLSSSALILGIIGVSKAYQSTGITLSSSSSKWNAWNPPGVDDVRGPCPALNVLANHGYIPHSGKGISKQALVDGLQNVFNFAPEIGMAFFEGTFNRTEGYVGSDGTQFLDLYVIREHNQIEHDASLFRYDYNSPGNDNFTPQPSLVNQMKGFAVNNLLDMTAVSKARLLRIQQEKAFDAKYFLDDRLDHEGTLESGFIYRLFGTGKSIPVDWIDNWFLKEQIPSDFDGHSTAYGFANRDSDYDKIKACERLLSANGNAQCEDV